MFGVVLMNLIGHMTNATNSQPKIKVRWMNSLCWFEDEKTLRSNNFFQRQVETALVTWISWCVQKFSGSQNVTWKQWLRHRWPSRPILRSGYRRQHLCYRCWRRCCLREASRPCLSGCCCVFRLCVASAFAIQQWIASKRPRLVRQREKRQGQLFRHR